jgi:two-component system, sensor histidine kinase LadS
MPSLPRFALALCIGLLAAAAEAAALPEAGTEGWIYAEGSAPRVASRLFVYEDAAGSADPAQVLRLYGEGSLAPLGRSSLSAGYTRSAFWFVLPLPSGAEGRRLVLFTTDTGLYRLEGFVPRSNGSFDRLEGSYLEPFNARAAPIVSPSLSFTAPYAASAARRVLLFKVSSDSSFHTSFILTDAAGLYKYKYSRAILLAAVFAILVALLAYNALVLLIARERQYLFYILYLATYIFYLADLQGIDFQFLYPNASGSWTRTLSPLLGSGALVLSALFARAFLGIDRKSRGLSSCLYVLMALGSSLAIVSVSGLRYDLVSRYGNDLASFIVVAVIAIAIVRIIQGFRPAAFFLVANAGVVGGVLAYGLGENGLVQDGLLVSSASLLGQALQLILFSVSLAYKLNLEKRERIAAQETLLSHEAAFRRFIPFEFLDFLGKKEISEVSLGQNVEKEMSVMFADIRSFTSLSEAMTPRENFDFINDYLQRIVPTVKDYGGFIDKFMGDSIMALFPHEAGDALRAAVEMQQAITDYNEERAARGEVPIRAGIGLHTGSLMLGIIGDEERLESTVISDAVNLASRVEKLNKFFGTSILITEETFKGILDPLGFQYRFLGRVKVKGKSESSSIFEVFGGETEELRQRKLATQRDFEQGLVAYLLREFPRARSLFAEVLRANREDRAAFYYYLHAKRAMETPPEPGWDGTIDSPGS